MFFVSVNTVYNYYNNFREFYIRRLALRSAFVFFLPSQLFKTTLKTGIILCYIFFRERK